MLLVASYASPPGTNGIIPGIKKIVDGSLYTLAMTWLIIPSVNAPIKFTITSGKSNSIPAVCPIIQPSAPTIPAGRNNFLGASNTTAKKNDAVKLNSKFNNHSIISPSQANIKTAETPAPIAKDVTSASDDLVVNIII